ncbi:hypothetical protein ACFQ7N_39840 [Streptomyces niveus]|uniref:hypothetical protein n=1 Tax=Streptomyces niveus TaxID=193462 RepID=UPI0036CBC472
MSSMGVEGWKRYVLLVCAGGCGVAATGLITLAVVGDLATADQVGSVVGATVSLVGLFISVWALLRSASAAVEARDGAVAAGGHVGRVISGSNNRSSALPVAAPDAPAGGGVVRASGTGSTAAAGNVHEVIRGDGNST